MAHSPSGLVDDRTPAFCFQTHDALDAIRAHYRNGAHGALATALGVYLVFTELANRANGHAARAGFQKGRGQLAAACDMSVDTLDRYVSELEAAGVLEVVRQRIGDVNLPNVWRLVSPPSRSAAATPSRAPAATPSRSHAAQDQKETKAKERNSPSGEFPTSSQNAEPPKLTKIAKRDQAFDALSTETGGARDQNAQRRVALGLNGSKGLVGIRQLAWDELAPAAREAYAADPEQWERYLAAEIAKRARLYRWTMGDAMLTPQALAKWWGSVETLKRSGGMTPAEIIEAGRRLGV